MADWRRLGPLLGAVAIAVAGLVWGAHLQSENVLPKDWESQQESNQRTATGDVVALSGIVVALGATLGAATLAPAPRRARERWLPLGAIFLGTYLLVNLLQTAWPFYFGAGSGGQRQATLFVNLLASNAAAIPSVLVPVFALWVAGLLALIWGVRRILRPDEPERTAIRTLKDQAGTLLLAAPFLGLASWGCLRLMVALPAVPGATSYRVLLSLAALAFLGLLLAGAAKAWQLMRALRDPRVAPLAIEAWEGIGRIEVGLVVLVAMLAIAGVLLPSFPPDPLHCLPIDPSAHVACKASDPTVQYNRELGAVRDLLQTQTFGTQLLHVHLALLSFALLPLAPMAAIHRRGARLLETLDSAQAVPALWTPLVGAGLGLSLVLGGAATWFASGAALGWVAAALPIAAVAGLLASTARQAQSILLAAWAAWAMGNSFAGKFGSASGLQLSDASGLVLWRLLGASLVAWALTRLVHASSEGVRPSLAIPLAGGTAVASLALMLLELPLDIWVLGSSVFVGTAVAHLDLPAAIAVHLLSLCLSLGAAGMAARLARPNWFKGANALEPLPAGSQGRRWP